LLRLRLLLGEHVPLPVLRLGFLVLLRGTNPVTIRSDSLSSPPAA